MQGKIRLLAAIGGLAALILTTPALAVMSVPYGWYLEGNIGKSNISGRSYSGGGTSTSGVAGNLDIGYKFMPFFGLEIGYTRYSNVNIKDPISGSKAAYTSTYSYDLAGKGIVPVSDSGVEAFAKVGISRISAHTSLSNSVAASNIGLGASTNNTASLYIAVGASYNFFPEMAVNLQWAQAEGNSKTGSGALTSVGISYNFG